jgi:hypothetical protein
MVGSNLGQGVKFLRRNIAMVGVLCNLCNLQCCVCIGEKKLSKRSQNSLPRAYVCTLIKTAFTDEDNGMPDFLIT